MIVSFFIGFRVRGIDFSNLEIMSFTTQSIGSSKTDLQDIGGGDGKGGCYEVPGDPGGGSRNQCGGKCPKGSYCGDDKVTKNPPHDAISCKCIKD